MYASNDYFSSTRECSLNTRTPWDDQSYDSYWAEEIRLTMDKRQLCVWCSINEVVNEILSWKTCEHSENVFHGLLEDHSTVPKFIFSFDDIILLAAIFEWSQESPNSVWMVRGSFVARRVGNERRVHTAWIPATAMVVLLSFFGMPYYIQKLKVKQSIVDHLEFH